MICDNYSNIMLLLLYNNGERFNKEYNAF